MTKQSIVVPEAVAVVMPVASGSSSLLQFPPPRSTGAGRYDVDRKLLAHLELRGRINGWVESMKASSPTHSLEDAINPWIVKRPSALEVFDETASRFAGKQMVMFLDYDGTLSPIVNDPDRAFMSDDMRAAVRDVASYFPTAIVTGRCCDKVCSFVRLPELYYAGSHGMDIKGPENLSSSTNPENKAVLFQPASEFFPMIEKVYNALLEETSSVPGTKVENNRFCVSVHFRCVDEKRWSALAEKVRSVMKEYPKLRLTQGRKVLEIRPSIKWDKGKALEFLLESLGFSNREDVLPIYIGDDRTDEDAFKVLRDRGQGFGVLVSKFPKETNASYSLQDPSEVMDFLNCLVEWKRLSSEACAKSANRVST